MVKLGTYPATLTASDWHNVLQALEVLVALQRSQGLNASVESTERTIDRLTPQVS